jgi:hypothetical protein
MVAIEGIGRPTTPRGVARGSVADGRGFALPQDAPATANPPASPTVSPAALG